MTSSYAKIHTELNGVKKWWVYTKVRPWLMAGIVTACVASALYCWYRWGGFLHGFNTSIYHTSMYILFFAFTILISLMTHREIRHSLKDASESEKELKEKRDYLEHEVKIKTKELRDAQLQRMSEVAKMVEFGRFSQGLLHDLLSPLTGLALHMEKVQKLDHTEIVHAHASLEKITQASQRMNTAIEKMRQTMRSTTPPRPCSVRTELLNSIELLTFKAYSHNVALKLSGDEDCVWYGDSLQLYQIVSNIISNAIDSHETSDQEHRYVHITLYKKDSYIYIRIQDNGMGMSPETIAKIGAPYFTTKKPEYGTGLGLTIVKKILGEIEGTLDITSTLGEGSTFTVKIPAFYSERPVKPSDTNNNHSSAPAVEPLHS